MFSIVISNIKDSQTKEFIEYTFEKFKFGTIKNVEVKVFNHNPCIKREIIIYYSDWNTNSIYPDIKEYLTNNSINGKSSEIKLWYNQDEYWILRGTDWNPNQIIDYNEFKFEYL